MKLVKTFLFLLLVIPANAQIRSENDRWMNRPAEPFKIIGNIYYVGASDVTSFLITTPKGHILIDGGFEETAPRIEQNIEKLGFKFSDVKVLLNNHEHYDHAGGLAYLKKKSGAKLLAVKQQAAGLEVGDRNNFRFGEESSFKPVKVDEIIWDGQTISFGGAKLKTILTPGHTKGCTTWTMNVKHTGRNYAVVFQCSLSTLDYNLIDNPLYPNQAKDYENTFTKLKKLRVDVFLGSHAQFFKMEEKLKLWKENPSLNPFIDAQSHRKFVERSERAFKEFLEKQQKEMPKLSN